MHSGEYSAATALLEGAVSASAELGAESLKATALGYLGQLALAWGDHAQAREALDMALELTREARPLGLIPPLVARARLARAEGERDLARSLLEEAVDVARAGGEDPPRALLGMGDLAAHEGEGVAAQHLYGEALELARADGSHGHAARALDGLARIARDEGATQRATRFQGEALQLRHESREERGIQESLEVTARLGLTTDRVLHAARLVGAADALREMPSFEGSVVEGAPYKAGLEPPGQPFLGEKPGTAAFSRGGAQRVGHSVAQPSNGKSQGERDMDGWESLSEREQEVAALVAEGMTNQGIGERLVITPATVKTHLSHIFTKLGISKRSELAEEVWRRRREAVLGEGEPPERPGDGL